MWPDKHLLQYFKKTMLKLSSPLRTEHNGDENKENILDGQDIPKIKPEETASFVPSAPIYTPRDKTIATQLNGAKINGIEVNPHDKSESSQSSSPELIKSLHPLEVDKSISSTANLNETFVAYTRHNEILEGTVTSNGTELNDHLDGVSHEAEKINSDDSLNSAFDANASVNVSRENLENSEKQESLNSTIPNWENKYIPDNRNIEDSTNTELETELLNNKTFQISSIEDVLQTFIIKNLDEKEIHVHKARDSLTLLDSEISLLVACAEENNLSSGDKSVQLEASVDFQKIDSLNDSAIADLSEDSFVITQKHSNLTSIEKENSEHQRIVLDDSQSGEIKADNYENENSSTIESESCHNHGERSEFEKNSVLLSNSSVEIATTEIPAGSKEGLQDSLVSPSQNKEIESKSCNSGSPSSYTDPENCDNNLIVLLNDEKSQSFNKISVEESILTTANTFQVANSVTTSCESPQTFRETENSISPEHKLKRSENQSAVSSTEVKSNKISRDSFSSQTELQNSVPVIRDLTLSSIDNRIEENAANLVVGSFDSLGNNITTPLVHPLTTTGTENSSELEQRGIENQSGLSAIEVQIIKTNSVENCQDSKIPISSQVKIQNSESVIEDLAIGSIDNCLEDNAGIQVVDSFEKASNALIESPQIYPSVSLIPQIQSEEDLNDREYLKVSNCSQDLPLQDSPTLWEDSFDSDNEPDPHSVTVVTNSAFLFSDSPEPEVCASNLKNTSQNGSQSCIVFEENSCLTTSCIEAKADKSSLDKAPDIPKIIHGDVKKMADINEKLQQENSDLKLELNASKQAKASLELEVGKKDEIILKTQAEAIKKEQQFHQEIKSLKEQLKEKSSINEKDFIKDLEEALKESRAKESQAVSELNARIIDELNYRKIMEEYEKTIAARIADCHKLKEENETVTKHLANLELSFSDVHQKYERAKTIIDGYKSNEEKLRNKFAMFEDTFHKQEEKYESLKAHAKAQLEKSNKEIMKYKEKYDSEVNKLNAIVKRLEIKSAALETSLDQKTNECIALAALCDEVTGKKV